MKDRSIKAEEPLSIMSYLRHFEAAVYAGNILKKAVAPHSKQYLNCSVEYFSKVHLELSPETA